MRLHTLFVLAAGLLLAAEAPAPRDDATKKDMAKFQGTWTVVEIERNGEKDPEDRIKDIKLTVNGNKRTLKRGDEVVAQSTFKLDASKSPKQIDITLESGDAKGRTFHGIYEIDGDTQKVCLNLMGDDRPKDFSAKADSGCLLQVFKREKK
jgi:uncharacterized protein (TIGR03067 family)